MIIRRLGEMGLVYLFLIFFSSSIANGATTIQDSVGLHQPENVSIISEMRPSGREFTLFIKFDDIVDTDSTGSYIHPPDTTYWRAQAVGLLSIPSVRGVYSGNIDRTINFEAIQSGEVGVSDSLDIRYNILYPSTEMIWNNMISVGDDYTPGTWIDAVFTRGTDTLDLGIELSFSPGVIDVDGFFKVGCEDFEGFHIWRGIEPDGSDLVCIGELSKEEAVRGSSWGGSVVDSLYFFILVDSLRSSGEFDFGFPVECFGNVIELELEENQFFWYDCNTFNGFTYYYAVTTFDRGYNILSGTQGLRKKESCLPVLGEPYACQDGLVKMSTTVITQDNLAQIYAVPNPYRTGGSVYTTPKYHNYPDNKIRFVNVPANCQLKIYTVSGDLVWETDHHDVDSGNIEWDVRNGSGEELSSGVYIYKVQNEQGDHVYGRLIVIR